MRENGGVDILSRDTLLGKLYERTRLIHCPTTRNIVEKPNTFDTVVVHVCIIPIISSP